MLGHTVCQKCINIYWRTNVQLLEQAIESKFYAEFTTTKTIGDYKIYTSEPSFLNKPYNKEKKLNRFFIPLVFEPILH